MYCQPWPRFTAAPIRRVLPPAHARNCDALGATAGAHRAAGPARRRERRALLDAAGIVVSGFDPAAFRRPRKASELRRTQRRTRFTQRTVPAAN